MTTLFKSEKKDVKASFPKINASDDFKNKFFKLARYVSKVADVNSVDILECIKVLEGDAIDFSAYDICSFEELLTDSARAATNVLTVLDSRTKADVSDTIFCYAKGELKKPIYLIVPSCPTANDGSLFRVRGQFDYRSCRIYSVGYLLVASALEQAVKNSFQISLILSFIILLAHGSIQITVQFMKQHWILSLTLNITTL